jgi:long-chain acyl-CoA synthetase
MLTISDSLHANAVKWPTAPCLSDAGRRFTFAETDSRVNRLASGLLALGCEPGDAIAVYARNSIEYMELFHACSRLGMRLVTLNFWHRPAEMAVLLNHSEARWLVVAESSQAEIAAVAGDFVHVKGIIVLGAAGNIPGMVSWSDVLEKGGPGELRTEVDPQAPFWMMYTSGTTGDPKGLYRSHLRTTMCLWAGIIEFGFQRNDRFLALAPFFHGVHFLPLMVLQTGGGVHIESEFDAGRVLEMICSERITSTFMVPTVLTLLSQQPGFETADLSSLRTVVTGGAALPTALKTSIIRVAGPVLHEFYGASESGFITVLHPEDQLRKERCCGQPAFGAEVEIRGEDGAVMPRGQVGEVFTRCEGRFDAYYKDSARTSLALRDGWFTAGDLGRMDEEGFVYIVDRKSDLVISGGENVYPREIEDVLSSHPAVLECAVIGVPDDVWGEAVKAFVVRRSGHDLTAQDVIAHCAQRLAGFKRPKHVAFVPELPKNASGKILRALLKQG